ncbi:DUF4352 domain-containing protein [Umezawaea endophytica]|uniref:DUF4352 domain-containing protein n=1 Tax=Umezawaea endophytica TaxID=1654476 RepID=A0A9X2VK68_9PSEU|nr:DUF4352 domain-containing protein [Umezawaea endophytica]MCS7478150.1 DUF4352 domain-containing protein [Umezawaea endophytica]
MDPRRALATGLTAVVVLTACTANDPAPPPSPRTYSPPPETARADETVLHLPAVTDGDTSFVALGLTSGMDMVIGSHAEWQAKGQYVRVRLLVTSNGRSTVLYDARRPVLIDSAGREHATDVQAMSIKRQPDKVELGFTVKLEHDVYFDIPDDAKPAKLRVFGGPTLMDQEDLTGPEIDLNP